jgi:hypothetical protein
MFENVWGIYKDGKAVLDVDTCVSVNPDASTKVSHFPVEKGAFASYNKAREPKEIKVEVAVGGQDRIQKLQGDLDRLLESIELFDVWVPEWVFVGYNLKKYAYKRSNEHGKNMIKADLDLVEIRQVAPQYGSVTLPNAKKKTSKNKEHEGKKQTGAMPFNLFKATKEETKAFYQSVKGGLK